MPTHSSRDNVDGQLFLIESQVLSCTRRAVATQTNKSFCWRRLVHQTSLINGEIGNEFANPVIFLERDTRS